jgi:hypothetical protein
MPWQFKPKKDVWADDTLRWGGNKPLTRRCPNGETYLFEEQMFCSRGDCKNGNRVKWNISVTRGKEKKGDKFFTK